MGVAHETLRKGRHLLGTPSAPLCDSTQSSRLQGLRGSRVKSTDTQPLPAAFDHFLHAEKHHERKASDKSLRLWGCTDSSRVGAHAI